MRTQTIEWEIVSKFFYWKENPADVKKQEAEPEFGKNMRPPPQYQKGYVPPIPSYPIQPTGYWTYRLERIGSRWVVIWYWVEYRIEYRYTVPR